MAEQRREKLDESLDKLHKLKQRWNKRLTLDNLALTERYLKGELRVVVHLRSRPAATFGRNSEEWCAVFQRKLPVGGTESYGHRKVWRDVQFGRQVGHVIEGASEVENNARVCHANGHQELVFVHDVELMELPKRVLPSLVRLGLLYEVHSRLRRSLYLSRGTGFKSIGEGRGVLEVNVSKVVGSVSLLLRGRSS